MTLFYVISFSLVGGLGAILLSSLFLLLPREKVDRLLPTFVSFSTGTLLGAAFLGMIPHATEHLALSTVLLIMLAGIVAFFVLEKLLIWRHCHKHDCEVHATSGALITLGDSFHNFVDGVVIGAAFLESTSLGMATAISAVAHEIPQEIGEFMILLQSGYSRRKAFLMNAISSLTTVVGAVLAYYLLSEVETVSSYLMAFAAAGFLYVALADLIPAQRGRITLGRAALELLLALLGIGVIFLVIHEH